MKGHIFFIAGALVFMFVGISSGGQRRDTARTPHARWKQGPSADPNVFPIAVWLQSPVNAKRYQAAGINLYVGLWQGPTVEQLAALKAAGMPVICEQNAVGLTHRDDPTIVGWMHGDEPDNAQPVTDPTTWKQGYGPPVPPSRIVEDYRKLREKDPTRPVFLNLGQGVANDGWIGRGSEGKPEDYLTYVKGGDIVSFDVYPVAGLENGEDRLWYVAKGVRRLREWTGGKKIVWNCLESTRIGNEYGKPTPHQVRAEAWMSIIHGSTGLIWFVHEFAPKFNEHALLDDPVMLPAVTALNKEIQGLAPVIHSSTVTDGVKVVSTSGHVPLACMVKKHGGTTYLFTVGMRNGPTIGHFTVEGAPKRATVEVLGEGRTLQMEEGRFRDTFKPYDVHLYRIQTR